MYLVRLWNVVCLVFLFSCGGNGPILPDDGDENAFILESANLTPDGRLCRISGVVLNQSNKSCSVHIEFTFKDSSDTIVADASDVLTDVPARTRSAFGTASIRSRLTNQSLTCTEVSLLARATRLESHCR
jgi:hypothetical protein